MTSTYDARGRRVGATVIKIEPNFVVQTKTSESKDGYNAIQLGSGLKKNINRPQSGHIRKAGLDSNLRYLKEIRTEETALKPGTEITLAQVFSIGDAVKVTGISKGKGFQGGVRRHGFAGGPKTHGQSDRHRAPGSIGQTTTPGRVYKGKKMAGHMGVDQITTRNLEVVGINKAENLLTVKGAVPGHTDSLIVIERLGRIKGYIAPPEEKPDEEEGESTADSLQSSEKTEDGSLKTEVATEGEENAES